MQKSPAAIVKEKFGDKAKLVAALGPLTQDEDLWLSRVNPKKGLERVSNAKLLRLHRVLSEVKEKFGTRTKLVDAVCDLEKRAKDEGYKKRLLAYPVPRLFDLYRALAKRTGVKVEGGPKPRVKAEGKTSAAAAPRAATAKAEAKPAARAKSGGKAAAPAKKKAGGSAKSKSSKKK